MNMFKKIARVVKTWRTNRDMPLRLEFVLSDFCNLNCKGCGHYSSLALREFEPLDRLRESMRKLGKSCGRDIRKVYLIGGEPLLYPELPEAMKSLREAFPDSEAYIFTNGIALPRMSGDFWRLTRSLGFTLAVTVYPIKFDYDKVLELIDSKGVKKEIFADRGEGKTWFKFGLDPDKRQNPRISHFKCFNRGCVSVIGDRVYPCSVSGCIGHLNRKFGFSFEHRRGDWIAVDDVRDAGDIRRLRDNPVPFCGYCLSRPEPVAYGPSARTPEEWIGGSGDGA